VRTVIANGAALHARRRLMPRPPAPPSRARRAETAARPIAARLALPREHVGMIQQSHERCRALGLSRIERPDHAPLGRADLAVAMDRNQRLHTHAAPVMEMLFDQIAGAESMVVLCDATGTIIHSVGDDDFLARASKVALTPGVNWSEQAKGTNAIGTTLVDEVPMLVHADEHFMHANQFLTCSAAPILDPRGNILGVLDVTGDHHSYHRHTMALVRMSARMIENHWLSDDFRNAMRLHFHQRVDFIGTLMEGILAVSPDGRIVGANRSALDQLGLSGAALRMHGLGALFGTSVGALVDRFRSPLSTPLTVTGPAGSVFHVHARFDWPVWSQVTEAAMNAARRTEDGLPRPQVVRAPASAQSPSAAAPSASLAQLETGDPRMAALVATARRLRNRDIPLLILGETGTGKETLARAIHADSSRAAQPFVAVHCASLPADQIELELFGSEDGTFPGARRRGSPGRIRQADGGTLFLDEVGDLPLPLQARLLQVLQDCRVAKGGGPDLPPVDLAVVCASRDDLRDRIAAQTFREDLYYRLNGLSLRLPPLRDRSDLTALVRVILDRDLQARHLSLAPEVVALFAQHAWPGNVRQLFNVLRLATVMAGGDTQIRREHLPEDVVEDLPPATPVSAPKSLHALEHDAIRAAVDAHGGNISAASKQLGISRNTIYRRLKAAASHPA
jgi:transcriptional regulator of acetoin/glycerol metabolism